MHKFGLNDLSTTKLQRWAHLQRGDRHLEMRFWLVPVPWYARNGRGHRYRRSICVPVVPLGAIVQIINSG